MLREYDSFFRIKFVEHMAKMSPKIVCPILAKEIQDFTQEKALVQVRKTLLFFIQIF